MKRTLTAAALTAGLMLTSVTPAHASHSNWIDTISPSNWVCKIAPVFC